MVNRIQRLDEHGGGISSVEKCISTSYFLIYFHNVLNLKHALKLCLKIEDNLILF